MHDTGIVNGTAYIAGNPVACNVYFKNGLVSAASTDSLPCAETVDATGKLVLPGFIDPHVHFALGVGANRTEDDFRSGSAQGALGGVTTYVDFLDPVKTAGELAVAFDARLKLAGESVTDFAFHATVANPTDPAAAIMDACVERGMSSIKLFTTYSDTDRRTYDRSVYELLALSRAKGVRISAHAENDDLISLAPSIPVADHETSRPVISELTAAVNLALMARETKGLLYVVHVSAGSTVAELERSFAPELRDGTVVLETCPHYLIFSSDRYADADGWRYTMTPPLRAGSERDLLRRRLGAFSCVGTDHCVFPAERKRKANTRDIAMGIGGIRHSFASMFTEFGPRVIPLFTENPARVHGLYPRKGNLLPGADADAVIFDPAFVSRIDDPESVYHGRETRGKIETVFLRGDAIVKKGEPAFGSGTYIRREIHEAHI